MGNAGLVGLGRLAYKPSYDNRFEKAINISSLKVNTTVFDVGVFDGGFRYICLGTLWGKTNGRKGIYDMDVCYGRAL